MQRVGAEEIRRILAVTDGLGIHREAVSIPLACRGAGAVRLTPAHRVEIVAPADGDFAAWLTALPAALRQLDLGTVQKGG